MVVVAVVIAAMGYMAYKMVAKKPVTSAMSVPMPSIAPVEGATTPALAQMISNAAAGGAGINSVFS